MLVRLIRPKTAWTFDGECDIGVDLAPGEVYKAKWPDYDEPDDVLEFIRYGFVHLRPDDWEEVDEDHLQPSLN